MVETVKRRARRFVAHAQEPTCLRLDFLVMVGGLAYVVVSFATRDFGHAYFTLACTFRRAGRVCGAWRQRSRQTTSANRCTQTGGRDTFMA